MDITNTTTPITGEVIRTVNLDATDMHAMREMSTAEASEYAIAALRAADKYEGKVRDAIASRATVEEKIAVINSVLRDSMSQGPEALKRTRERVLTWFKRNQLDLALPEGQTLGISGQGLASLQASRAKRLAHQPTQAEVPVNPEERERSAQSRLEAANEKIQALIKERAMLKEELDRLKEEKKALEEELLTALTRLEALQKQQQQQQQQSEPSARKKAS